ncbi:hypothetical protein IGI04_043119 [Brassica rapa subsp. trilocularis]|uniref:Uncharacterized protein n=1 Tax=Brassica rapa subsp. trilocularis TaxID=1813537 RepID=A0ABQ7KHS6_BRACM|nr:hypothetical protein IGI04_043119 [Brassica rapa subsp. trilocularis]
MDSRGRPVCADGQTRTHTDSHGRPVCADGHPRTTDSPRGPKSPEQSTGRVNVLSPRTNVLICVLRDSHGHPVCADGHTRTHTESHRRPVCADGHTRTVPLCVAEQHPQNVMFLISRHPLGPKYPTSTERPQDVPVLLTDKHGHTRDSHGHPVCATDNTRTSWVCGRNAHGHLCVHDRQPQWGQNHPTGHEKGSVLSPKDQHLIVYSMDSHGRLFFSGRTAHKDGARTACVC